MLLEWGIYFQENLHASMEHVYLIRATVKDRQGILDDETPQFKPPMPHLRQLMKRGTHSPRSMKAPAATDCVRG